MDHLSGLSQYTPTVNITVSNTGSQSAAAESSKAQETSNKPFLEPGSVIQGEIVGIDGKQIQIAVNGEQVISAHLEQEIELLLGQKLLFAIRGSRDTQISLSPLFENLTKQETAQTALREANLPITDHNLKMIATLMEEGMSIDKSMLTQMNKALTSFPEASMQNIAQLMKMQIPVTSENIQQFGQYLENQHQMVQGMQDVMEQVPQMYQQLLAQTDANTANQILAQIFDTFTEQMEGAAKLQETADMTGNVTLEQETGNAALQGNVNESLPSGEHAATSQESVTQTDMVQGKTLYMDNTLSNIEITSTQREALGAALKNIGVSNEFVQQVTQGSATPEQVWMELANALQNRKVSPEHLQELLKSDAFRQITTKVIEKQWMIRPEDVAKGDSVNKLYERLDRQLERIQESLQAAGEGTVMAKTVQNMRSNVNFMNDLNHMFTYVQLPLKFSESKAHGDLYVYTNKKSLAQKNGELSALLHLDMEHLGSLDVHVLLQNGEKVSTKFFVQDEEALDMISQHIDMLNQALQTKGYQSTTNVTVREEQRNVMEEILEENKQHVPISTHSFDARA